MVGYIKSFGSYSDALFEKRIEPSRNLYLFWFIFFIGLCYIILTPCLPESVSFASSISKEQKCLGSSHHIRISHIFIYRDIYDLFSFSWFVLESFANSDSTPCKRSLLTICCQFTGSFSIPNKHPSRAMPHMLVCGFVVTIYAHACHVCLLLNRTIMFDPFHETQHHVLKWLTNEYKIWSTMHPFTLLA